MTEMQNDPKERQLQNNYKELKKSTIDVKQPQKETKLTLERGPGRDAK